MLYEHLIEGIRHRNYDIRTAREIFSFFELDKTILDTRIGDRKNPVNLGIILRDIKRIRDGRMGVYDHCIRRLCLNPPEDEMKYHERLVRLMLRDVKPLEPPDWVKQLLGKNALLNASLLYGSGFSQHVTPRFVKWRQKCDVV